MRRGSIAGALVLIAIGVLFLFANLRPGIDPWSVLGTYWPVILLVIGIGKIWDYYRLRNAGVSGSRTWIGGPDVAVVVLIIVLAVALSRGSGRQRFEHETQTVDRKGNEAVNANIEIPAGNLELSGGANNLLEANFAYLQREGKPVVSYDVSGNRGELAISQRELQNIHFWGRRENDWKLRFSDDVPLELTIRMGAGTGELRLGGLSVTKLDIQGGVGSLDADLSGLWKKDLDATVQGGVGAITIRLPKDVGVHIHTQGGIGAVQANGLRRDGDDYVNDAYGKSPVTLRLSVGGGVGTVDLVPVS